MHVTCYKNDVQKFYYVMQTNHIIIDDRNFHATPISIMKIPKLLYDE